MPHKPEPCPFAWVCPVYQTWQWMGHAKPFAPDMVQLAREFNDYRRCELERRLENQEPWRSTIDMLTHQNAELRDWKRKTELFLLSQGLALPPD